MKKIKILALIGLIACGTALFAACGRDIDTPTGFTIDQENKLSWDAVDGARNYLLEILDVDTGEKKEVSSRKTNYSLDNLEEGDYEIRIKAVAGDKNAEDSEWSEICYFTKGYETGCIYSLVNNIEYEILKYGSASGDVFIEDMYRGKPVTSIAEAAFKGAQKITNVVIGNNVTYIGDRAFYNCSNLESVTIPDTVTTIGEAAFQSCSSLKSISIPDAVTTLEKNTFVYCRGLESVDFGSGLTTIGEAAFSDCSALTSITLPDTVTSIGKWSFTAMDELTEVTFGSGLVTIGFEAFYDCEKLETINFAEGGALTTIGESAFGRCVALSSVTIPEGVKQINTDAFTLCSSLETVDLPESLEFIRSGAFGGTKLYIDAVNAQESFVYADGWLIGCNVKDTLQTLTADMFKEGTVGIGDEVFSKCKILELVALPSSVKRLGEMSFYMCPLLWSADLSNSSVETVSYGAFASCPVLKTVKLKKADGSSSIKRIENSAFIYCYSLNNSALASSFLPESLTSIGANAFLETGLWNSPDEYGIVYAGNWVVGHNKVEVWDSDNLPPGWDSAPMEDGEEIEMPLGEITLRADTVGIAEYAFYECVTLTAVSGLSSVQYIGRGAFSKCRTLERVNLNPDLKVIEPYTFNNCTALFDVSLPTRLTTIGRGAFQKCEALNSLDLSNTNVQTIDAYAFYGCTNIEEILFNEDLVSIGDYTFYSCTALKELALPDSVETIGMRSFGKCETLNKLTIGAGLEAIPERAFQNCVALKDVVIPANVKTIGNYAFYKCTALTTLAFEEGVTEIGNYAFYGVENLQRVSFANSVESIGKYAFKGCNMLQSITLGDNIKEIGAHAFYGCKQMTVYAEAESIPEGWHVRWNSSYRPVIWGCTLSEDNSYVVSVTIKEDTVFSKKETDVIVSPKRAGYTFAGWSTAAEGTEIAYAANKIGEAPVGTTLYAVWTEGDEPLIKIEVPDESETPDTGNSSDSSSAS